MIPTLEWTAEGVRFLDQTRLPLEEVYVLATTYNEVADVITTMVVRGAPAIGVSGAMGVAIGVQKSPATTIAATLIREANNMYDEDIAACRSMGAFGAELLPSHGGVLTHCNAGALATCGYGTALGVIRAAVERGHEIHVYADETRPFLQGARLTAWELMHDGIPTTVLCDNMAASLMRQGKIQAVIVGADRIAANGDVANKIGTYNVAILAKEHGIPFYVAAPWSTIDLATATGDAIPIEQRSAIEVTHHAGKQLTPHGVGIENPAFDVTPAKYISAIITERGILRAPFPESIRHLAEERVLTLA